MPTPGDGGVSVVRRWKLAATLKAAREEANIRQEHAVELLRSGPGRWSRSKLSRIENREQTAKPRDVEQLLDIYGVTDDTTRQELARLAEGSHEQGWWAGFSNDLPDGVKPLLSIESGLVALRDFQNQLVHGLLQTSDYARALMNAVYPGSLTLAEIERRVAARMVRQQLLTAEGGPDLHFILDQGVLERPVGNAAAIMRDQLRRLLEVAEHPKITLQVLPTDVGGNPGMEGPFAILTLPEPIPDIGYTEGPAGSLYLEEREQVRMCTLRFGALTEIALSQGDSNDAIMKALSNYE